MAFLPQRLPIYWRRDTLPGLGKSVGAPGSTVWPETLYDVLWVIEADRERLRMDRQDFRPPDTPAENPISEKGTT